MFGYLFPTKEVLTMPERKIFRNYFCTLCLAHRYRYGMLSSVLNNFDVGIFAVILDLYGNKIENCGKCGKYVTNKKEKFTEKKWGDIVDYNINLVRKKLEDDLHDKPSLQAIASYLGTSSIFRNCKQNNRDLYDIFDAEFENYMAVETKRPMINEILDAYEVFARNTFGALTGVKPEQLHLFASLNRWIYWIDAINDYDEDIKSGGFNPYVCYNRTVDKPKFLENNMFQLIDTYEAIKETIETAYSQCSYPLENRVILENVINHTVRNTTRLILENGNIPKRRRLL